MEEYIRELLYRLKYPLPAIKYPEFSTSMSAERIIKNSKKLGYGDLVNFNILTPDSLVPFVPPVTDLSYEELHPSIRIISVNDRRLAISPKLRQLCFKEDICVIRGAIDALEIDCNLFTTKALLEADSEQIVEVRKQLLQNGAQNLVNGIPAWQCKSEKVQVTLKEYATYQNHSKQAKDIFNVIPFKKAKKTEEDLIYFGTNFDLSDKKLWEAQLKELEKLPGFLRVSCASNMLTYVGHNILGVNTVQVYMKVPGARTPGHQENNNICSVNINIGPDDCEWFAIPTSHWGAIANLCQSKNINYLQDAWWPDLDELESLGIPVYRFLQHSGDIVWINCACIHWVQSNGWCNNVAWNTAPFTSVQYQSALERYEYNKFWQFKSLVPMVNLSWNLIRFAPENDLNRLELLKTCLMKSLSHCVKVYQFIQRNRIEIRFHGRVASDITVYCQLCEEELFNILFTTKKYNKYEVYCAKCVRRQSMNPKKIVCLEIFKLEDLIDAYNNFMLK